jgi:hypothetical protein
MEVNSSFTIPTCERLPSGISFISATLVPPPDYFVNQKISALAQKYHHTIKLLCMVQVSK